MPAIRYRRNNKKHKKQKQKTEKESFLFDPDAAPPPKGILCLPGLNQGDFSPLYIKRETDNVRFTIISSPAKETEISLRQSHLTHTGNPPFFFSSTLKRILTHSSASNHSRSAIINFNSFRRYSIDSLDFLYGRLKEIF